MVKNIVKRYARFEPAQPSITDVKLNFIGALLYNVYVLRGSNIK